MFNSLNAKTHSFHVNFENASTDLCMIGAKFDTDKSSQRKNVTNTRHCHPYTVLYHSMMSNLRDEPLNICELGILNGASLLMWQEYFPNANIYGFDFDPALINTFNNKYDTIDRITLSLFDVTNEDGVQKLCDDSTTQFDLIIEDTTHQLQDQQRVIRHAHKMLKPGGVLIIEDIFLKNDEAEYCKNMPEEYDTFYFVTMDCARRNSYGWDNDKVMILIKKGPRIFTCPLL
jgi:predicted O-methyltransferase YrrM